MLLIFLTSSHAEAQREIKIDIKDCEKPTLYNVPFLFLEGVNDQLLLRADSIKKINQETVDLTTDSSFFSVFSKNIKAPKLVFTKYFLYLDYCALKSNYSSGDTFWPHHYYNPDTDSLRIIINVMDSMSSVVLKKYILNDILLEYQEAIHDESMDSVLVNKMFWILGREKGMIKYGNKQVFFAKYDWSLTYIMCLVFDECVVILSRKSSGGQMQNFTEYISFSPISELFGNGISFNDSGKKVLFRLMAFNLKDKKNVIHACIEKLKTY